MRDRLPDRHAYESNTEFPTFSKKNPIRVPAVADSHKYASLIGTCSDYMFRFLVARRIWGKGEACGAERDCETAEGGAGHMAASDHLAVLDYLVAEDGLLCIEDYIKRAAKKLIERQIWKH